jgi:acetyl-CoA C-acetyltransferase
MLETAENLRREYRISRSEQDEFAVRSHRRAAAAQLEGRFADELVPVTVRTRTGNVLVNRDEHIRPSSTVETLARLRPILRRQDQAATVTAGNASGQNDGAAICVVTSQQKADKLGLRPLVRLVSWGVGGVPPATMGIGPVPAVSSALDAAELALRDVDLIEVNEAFAAQVLACTREWGFGSSNFERLNVNGSGIARTPGWCDRRANPRHPVPRDGSSRDPVWRRDHVHRRGSGLGRSVRAGDVSRSPAEPVRCRAARFVSDMS